MSPQEIRDGLAVIASLVLIEGLLSVDNVLGIAALARNLPAAEQKKAIRLGMAGAYLFRVLALLAASWLISNTWVRWAGAGYLLYLMASHLSQETEPHEATLHAGDVPAGSPGATPAPVKIGLAAVLVQIGLMDLSLSIDNVIAAVGLSEKAPDGSHIMWPVYAGVGFAILALQAIAPYAVKLLQRFPILEPTAFILIGYVGCILVAEEVAHVMGKHLHVESWQKFIGVVVITLIAFYYSNNRGLQRLFSPVFAGCLVVFKLFARTVEFIFRPASWLIHLLIDAVRKPRAA